MSRDPIVILINEFMDRYRVSRISRCRCHAQHAKEMNSFNKFSRNFLFLLGRTLCSAAVRNGLFEWIGCVAFFFFLLILHFCHPAVWLLLAASLHSSCGPRLIFCRDSVEKRAADKRKKKWVHERQTSKQCPCRRHRFSSHYESHFPCWLLRWLSWALASEQLSRMCAKC